MSIETGGPAFPMQEPQAIHAFAIAAVDGITDPDERDRAYLNARAEAAESEALEQARLNGMGSEREAALMAKLEAAEKDIAIKEEVIDSLATVIKRLDAQCDAAEKERDDLRAENAALVDDMNLLRDNNTALRAKIEAMERQVPICRAEDLRHAEILLPSLGLMPEDKLYALPGAKTQGEEK